MTKCGICKQKADMKVILSEKSCRNLCIIHYRHWVIYGQNQDNYEVLKI